MNGYLRAAAVLAFVVGLVHSVLGERLIFQRLRRSPQGGIVPTDGGARLHEKHVRILWASWHALTALGWGSAVILLWLALPNARVAFPALVEWALAVTMFFAALLVFVGTQGKHVGWVGLLGVSALIYLGSLAS